MNFLSTVYHGPWQRGRRCLRAFAVVLAAALFTGGPCVAQGAPPDFGDLTQACANANGPLAPNTPVPGAQQLTPGRYWDPARGGHGWDFFWYTPNGSASSNPSDQRLFVVFYTHRLEGGSWKPVWYGAVGTGLDFGFRFDPTDPTRRIGWDGELRRYRQIPRDSAQFVELEGGGDSGVVSEPVGTVRLAFTDANPVPDAESIGVHWQLAAESGNSAYAVDRTCLRRFGNPDANPPGSGVLDNLSGAWAQQSQTFWLLMAYFYGSYEQHLLLYFDGDANLATPRWTHAPLITESLPPAHACAASGATSAPPGVAWQGTWRHRCLLRVNGYAPNNTAAAASWQPESASAQTRVGWLSHTITQSGQTMAKVQVTPLDPNLPLFAARAVDGVRPLQQPTDIVHRNGASEIRVGQAGQGTPDAGAGAALECHALAQTAMCRLQLNWLTEGAYPGATLFKVQGSPPEYSVVATSKPRTASLGVTFDHGLSGDQFRYELWSDRSRRELLAVSRQVNALFSSVCTPHASLALAISAPLNNAVVNLAAPSFTFNTANAGQMIRYRAKFMAESAPGVWEVVQDYIGTHTSSGSPYTVPVSLDAFGDLSRRFRWTVQLFSDCAASQVIGADFRFSAPEVPDDPTYKVDDPALSAGWKPDPQYASDNGSGTGASTFAVGLIEADAGVHGGAASLSIPIVVPPGRRGIQPSLALNYSSRSGNGIAGMGFSLAGLSSVHRCPSIIDKEGVAGVVQYGANDRLCLDGQRLVLAANSAASYGNANAEYRTEIDNYARITQLGGPIHGADAASSYFKVESRSGEVHYYGAGPAGMAPLGRVSPTGAPAPLSWLLVRREDRSGNAMEVEYSDFGAGEVLPTAVHYTGTVAGASIERGDRRVSLTYEDRPSGAAANDISSSYLSGGLTRQRKRLKSIATYAPPVGSAAVRTYTLAYAQSAYTGRSLLASVSVCAADSSCLPARTFTWSQDLPAKRYAKPRELTELASLATLAGDEEIDPASIRPDGDYDGDGSRELRVALRDGRRLLVSTTASRTVRGYIDLGPEGSELGLVGLDARPVDFNGDGRTDLFGILEGRPRVGYWRSWSTSGFDVVQDSVTVLPAGAQLIDLADVNADGLTDLLVEQPYSDLTRVGPTIEQCANERHVVLYVRSTAKPDTRLFEAPRHLMCLDDQATPYHREFVSRVTDFDGNGIPDLFVSESTATSTTQIKHLALLRRAANGDLAVERLDPEQLFAGGSSDSHRQADSNDGLFRMWMDVNGDGLDDWLFPAACGGSAQVTWTIRLNQGGKLGSRRCTGSRRGLEFFAPSSVSSVSTPRYAHGMRALDVDADGRQELLMPKSVAIPVCRYHLTSSPVCDQSPVPGSGPGDPTNATASPDDVCNEAYYCPVDPVTGQEVTAGFVANGFPAFRPFYGFDSQMRGNWDDSTYEMSALQFIESSGATAEPEYTGRELETGIRTRLTGSQIEDAFGDGLVDVLGRIGCGWQDQVGAGYARCYIPPGSWPGLPDLPAGFNPAAGYRLFIAENPGVVLDGTTRVESPMPPDMLVASQDVLPAGVGQTSVARWSHHPLSIDSTELMEVQSGRSLPLYSIPARDSDASQADNRHFYFTSSMPVVSEFRISAGVDAATMQTRRYSYAEALYNNAGRGFRGFARIVEDNLDDGLRAVTDFKQKYPYSGAAECHSVVRLGDAGLPACTDGATPRPLRQTVTDWDAIRSAACPLTTGVECWQLHATADETTTNDLADRAKIAVERAARSFDDHGNVTLEVRTTEDYVPGEAVGTSVLASTRTHSTTSTFLKRTTASEWWPAMLTRSVTSSSVSYASGHAPAIVLPSLSRSITRIPIYSDGTCARQLPTATFAVEGIAAALPRNASATSACAALGTALDSPPAGTYHRQVIQYDSYGNVTEVSELAKGSSGLLSERRKVEHSFGLSGDQSPGYFQRNTTQHVLSSSGSTVVQHVSQQSTDPRFGVVDLVTDVNGLQTRMELDAWGQEKRRLFPVTAGLASAPSLVTTRQWCSGASRCGSAIGASAAWRVITQQQGAPVTRTFLDLRGRTVRSEAQAFAEGRWSAVQRQYNGRGLLIKETPTFDAAGNQSTVDAGTYTTFAGHDALGRPQSREWTKLDLAVGAAAGATTKLKTTYAYRGARATLTLQREGGNSAGEVPAVTIKRTHDIAGRVLSTVDASSGTTGFWYDGAGNPVLITDAMGNHTQASYDDLGRRTLTKDPNRGDWTFNYDGYGQVIEQRDARYSAGLYAWKQAYDSLGRPISREWQERKEATGTAAVCGRDEWTYDISGIGLPATSRRTIRAVAGGACQTTDLERVEEALTYDALFRPKQSYELIYRHARNQSDALTIRYAYDSNFGRLKSHELPGLVTTYAAYGPRGHLVEEGNAVGFVAYGSVQNRYYRKVTAMNAAGEVTESLLGNRATGASTYAPAMVRTQSVDEGTGRLRSICVRLSGDVANCSAPASSMTATNKIADIAYWYDVYDNLTQTQDVGLHLTPLGAPAATKLREAYAYDPLFRLTTVARGGDSAGDVTSYAYDAIGNLKKKTDFSTDSDAAYVYSTAGKPYAVSRVSRPGGSAADVSYVYDANGNLTKRQNYPTGYATTIHYDIDNRPRALGWSDTAQGATFSHRPDGSRYLQVQRLTANMVPTELVYSGKSYEREVGSAGVIERYYLPGGALLVKQNGLSTVSYLHGDRLGSITVVTDADGTVIEQRGFDPFGKPRDGNDWGNTGDNALNTQPTNAPRNRRGFTTHEHLDSFRLIHMNGRMFDFNLGRFYGVDPIIQSPNNGQSLNPYSYILNNPLSGTDPTGYIACGDVGVDKPSTGTCDFMQDGKTTEIGYSVGNNRSVAVGGSRNLSALSGVVSFGVISGADGMSVVGAQSGVRSGASSPGSIGASGTSVRSQAASILTPNIASLGNRGGVGSWAQRAAGWGKAAVNALGEFQDMAANRDYQGPVFDIADEELEGAAAFDVAGFVSAPLRSLVRGGLATAGTGLVNRANAYSVAFETTIDKLGAGTRPAHFRQANELALASMRADPDVAAAFATLGIRIPKSAGGKVFGMSPDGWTWHHVKDSPGVLQLVPRVQHEGAPWRRLFHPDGRGGFHQWGADY